MFVIGQEGADVTISLKPDRANASDVFSTTTGTTSTLSFLVRRV